MPVASASIPMPNYANSLEFIVESVHFMKADHYVGFYELFILMYSVCIDACPQPFNKIIRVPVSAPY
jgi:hypothetical protein